MRFEAAIAGFAPKPLRLLRLWYFCGLLLLLLVAVLSLMPLPDLGVSDKLSHLLTYVVLAGWFSLLVGSRRQLAIVVLGLLGYGMLIELLQGMTAYRIAEWGDVFANGLGICGGILLYFTPLKRILFWLDARLAQLFQQ